jgi:hypothetical protein
VSWCKWNSSMSWDPCHETDNMLSLSLHLWAQLWCTYLLGLLDWWERTCLEKWFESPSLGTAWHEEAMLRAEPTTALPADEG